MNIKTQRLVAILVLAVAIAFGGGIYLLQNAWKISSDLDSSNQLLLQENDELKEQLKQIPVLIQEGSSQGETAGDSSSDSPSLAQAEEVTKSCMQAYFTHDNTTSPTEKWEAFSPYLTEEAAENIVPLRRIPLPAPTLPGNRPVSSSASTPSRMRKGRKPLPCF